MPGGPLKALFVRKTQSLLGISRLCDQVQETNRRLESVEQAGWEMAAQASAIGRALAGHSSSEGLRPVESQEASLISGLSKPLRALEKQGLFILGCARSGTTILARSLNRCPEILLLEEPSYFFHEHVSDFVSFFNKLHQSMGNRCLKGTYLPPAVGPTTGPTNMLLKLSEDYQYVGEKSAFGPHDYPANWPQMYLDYQGKYFLRAKYILLVRKPAESIWSMHKLFPQQPIRRLFVAWLETLSLALDAYHVFPNARVVFFDDLGASMIERLADWLQLEIPVAPGTFATTCIHSAVSEGEVPDPLASFSELLHQCSDIYAELRQSFCRQQLTYCGERSEWEFFDTLLKRIERLLAVYQRADGTPHIHLHLAA